MCSYHDGFFEMYSFYQRSAGHGRKGTEIKEETDTFKCVSRFQRRENSADTNLVSFIVFFIYIYALIQNSHTPPSPKKHATVVHQEQEQA